MKTKHYFNLSLYVILFALLNTMFTSCKSEEEEVGKVAMKFMNAFVKGNPYSELDLCAGQMEEDIRDMKRAQSFFEYDYLGEVIKDLDPKTLKLGEVIFLPEYDDVAIAEIHGIGKPISLILHQNSSGEWKIYYFECSSAADMKNFITDDILEKYGIFDED